MNFELNYIDFHTHHPSLNGERVIQDGIDTQGRHPWGPLPSPPHKGGSNSYPPSFGGDRGRFEGDRGRLLALGESGLDRLCDTPYDLQLQVFREEVSLSEELQKPLFLHCVRAIDDVLRIRKELNARQPWIWHGYRGNAQQLQQILNLSSLKPSSPRGERGEGLFYFSFGTKFNTEALLACPLDRLLLETDDDTTTPIADLYARVAQLRGISLDALIRQMHENYRTLFRQ